MAKRLSKILILIIIFLTLHTKTYAEKYITPIKIDSQVIETYARQKSDISHGIYDPKSNKTFIVYSAGIEGELSAASPYIIAFDHTSETWSNPVEIQKSPVKPDSHNYPQILIDTQGYLHVFHTFHANHNILHAKSTIPGDINNWNVSYIPNTSTATYGAAVKANNGDFYLLYRSTLGNGILNPPLSNWYEPEYYLKSTDEGQSWTQFKLIDPLHREDVWNTIYTKAIHYESDPEGIHIAFGVHKNHNDYYNKHYYFFFNLNDDHIYGPDGTDYGTTITRDEFEACCELFSYPHEISFETYGNTRMTIDIDDSNNPIIMYSQLDPEISKDKYIEMAHWNGSLWDKTKLNEFGLHTSPWLLDYKSANDISVYINNSNISLDLFNFDGTEWTHKSNIYKPINRGVSHLNRIQDNHPDIKAVFLSGGYTHWSTPKPIGDLYAFSEQESLSPDCQNSDLNSDGIISKIDLLYTLKQGKYLNSDSQLDINDDGIINGIDATNIINCMK